MQFKRFSPSLEISALHTMYPSRLWTPSRDGAKVDDPARTSYGFALEGGGRIKKNNLDVRLEAGMYFSLTGPFHLSGEGKTVVIDRLGFRGMDQFGGPVEETGRLCYIDNCRSSILVPPPRLGDPVFNLLTFPPGVNQTMHIHPSIRMGLVYSGSGKCHTPKTGSLDLEPGMVFLLEEGEIHCFQSFDQPLIVIAYHPDSDVGPTDANHPMLSRTYTRF